MPDWSYHPIFKPILERLPGGAGREFIHKGMNTLSSLPGGRHIIEFLGHMSPAPELQKTMLGYSFQSPVGLSGKVDPLLSGTKAFTGLGFGFLEAGPVSMEVQLSSGTAVKHQDGSISYPVPLESIGVDRTISQLEKMKAAHQPLFIRIDSPASSMDLAAAEIIELAGRLCPYASAMIIENGWRFKQDHYRRIAGILKGKPVLLGTSPAAFRKQQTVIAALADEDLIQGIVLDEEASFSGGRQTFPLSAPEAFTDCLSTIRNAYPAGFPAIISGGVLEPEDAISLFTAGADLIMLSGGYVSSGPGLPKRINEAAADPEVHAGRGDFGGWMLYWLFGLFILIGGLIALFFSLTSVILPYDEHFLGISREDLILMNPLLIKFMLHDRMTLAGTMISGGILYMELARHGARNGLHWARKAINAGAVTGFLGILLFIGYGYFDWLHGLFWLILLPFFLLGLRNSKEANQRPRSINKKNTAAWRKSLWGQLCFVILGFSFVIGGISISAIGATGVFVQTDIGYICMTPEQMNNLNEKLIPLIAHDRAGFGSALFSVGLLVLMTALWGFRQGEKWVWRMLLIGGIPAFAAGILTHFYIGYTTFYHLLPAYFAFGLYIAGLVLTRRFFLDQAAD
ncbi:dihydroorotate dehydrogenase [Bacillus sp. AG4(2022)]|uniref:dihydroorotate dehydrogenase n=1 Tax=Bacillus sp. AG4(2022) TaxID=2962594 RepID=UPI002882C5B9|nr:dihydroorotate dehydrogenase [Bacillus sp. AG4(2022)]MDT0163044.1 dihydroorotate dehydrogenase [Bacillus sp. AG4(2022)]